jgi:hypothetical protein
MIRSRSWASDHRAPTPARGGPMFRRHPGMRRRCPRAADGRGRRPIRARTRVRVHGPGRRAHRHGHTVIHDPISDTARADDLDDLDGRAGRGPPPAHPCPCKRPAPAATQPDRSRRPSTPPQTSPRSCPRAPRSRVAAVPSRAGVMRAVLCRRRLRASTLGTRDRRIVASVLRQTAAIAGGRYCVDEPG